MNIKNYKKTGLFFGLSTVIPWSLWFIAADISHIETGSVFSTNLASLVAFLGLLAPVIITIALVRNNKIIKDDLLNRIFNFKGVKPVYLFLAFFIMLVSILLAQAISLLFGYSFEQFQLSESFSFTSGVFPVWFMLIIAPLLEELAWHSYGTDSLRTRFNLINTSIIFALFWGIWHFPLSFIKDYYHSNLVNEGWIYSVNFLVSLFPFVIIMNWIYYKTNRNIILPIVFHITAGLFNEIFATHPMSKVIQTVLLCLFSIYLLITNKEFFFNKSINITPRTLQKRVAKKKLPVVATISLIFLLCSTSSVSAQTLTQTIHGKVYDNITNETLPFASVVVMNTEPLMGTVTDIDGNFTISNVEIGRRTVKVSMIGYDDYEVNELLISSGQTPYLNIGMHQSTTQLDEVVVRVRKETALNSMTTLSSRQFTMEETQRYAGGMDDPARLASSFAGVATPSISSNGISVRGNNPDGLLWRIDGVEVPVPNHFANLTVAGGGLLTVISNQMMANSDFYTGAFPAEYGNASSGVFDIKLREGNSTERQYSFQAGILGVGLSAEGPFKAKEDATYVFNYRNSTMALVAPLLPNDAGILKYQDLSFKTNFPTKNFGTFSFWSIGAIDGIDMEAADLVDWETNFDRDNSQTSLYMYTSAISHKMSLRTCTFINTTLSVSGNGLKHKEQRLDFNSQAHPQSKAANNTQSITAQTQLTKRFSENHSNKTGIRYSYLNYDVDVEQSLFEGEVPTTIAKQSGNSGFMQAFTQSKINITPKLSMNAGLNVQYFLLNNNFTIEPRVGLKYNFNESHNLAIAYGLHSRLEQLPVYFVSDNGNRPNKNLEFMKSAHYILSYNARISDNIHICIEPYFQHLSDVPVSPYNYASTLNNINTLFYNEVLVSEGKGRNLGVDITLEKFLTKGYYYLITASIFDSKYTGYDEVERNTRFNRNFVFNAMVGKEWVIKNNNLLSANFRLNLLGGNRAEPVDMNASILQEDIVYAETSNKQAFSEKFSNQPIVSFTLSYRKNKERFSSVWSLQVINVNCAEEYAKDVYNIKTHDINTLYEGIPVPNLSYKIEF